MREIGIDELEDIAIGAAILGSGGGGDPYIGKLMALQAIRTYGPVTLIDPDEVPDDELVATSFMMGAPTVMVEKVPGGKETIAAFDALSAALGRPLYAVMSVESGGVNSMIPFIVAAAKHIPLVDGDTMGRAFPAIDMTTFSIAGIRANPFSMGDEKGNVVSIDSIDNRWTERLSRTATAEMGGSAFVATYSVTGVQLKAHAVARTISRCEEIGRIIRRIRKENDSVTAFAREVGAIELFRGKVIDIERYTDGKFVKGKATVEGLDAYKGHRLVVGYENENLVAERDGVIVATTPDLIVNIDSETALPVTTESIKYGFRIATLGIPCDPKWRTPAGLETIGPERFGFDVAYRPIEESVQKEVQ